MEINNPITMYVILGVVFLALTMIPYGIYQALQNHRKRRRIIETIQNNRDAWASAPSIPEEKPATAMGKFLNLFAVSGARLSKNDPSMHSAGRMRLLQAGIRSPNARQIMWGLKVWSPVIFVLVFYGLRLYLPQLKLLSISTTSVVLVAAGILGFYLPELCLSLKAFLRKGRIIKDLPDALDLLVVCVEAGLGLDSAFNRVAEEMKMSSPQMSAEFKLLNLELRAGKSRKDALRNLAMRVNVDSLQSLVTLLIQTEMFGTGIAKALRVFSDSFRTERFQKAEEIAAKLPVKMLIPTIFFIFPTFMAIMVGPAAISVWDNWLSK